MLGVTLFFLGEFALAQDHLEQGIALYDPQKDNPFVSGAVQDLRVSCLSVAALALWHFGYPGQALKRSQEALTSAQELSHPFSSAFALSWAALLCWSCPERQAGQERAEAAITLSTEQGFPHWLARGTILRGWALAEQGQGEAGIAQIHQGLNASQATGAEMTRTYFLALLAEAYGEGRQTEEGLSVLAEALAMVDKTGERFYEAELHRLKGELTLQKFQVASSKFQVADPRPLTPEPQAEAEACFQKAMGIAQRQQAKSLELRAVMSLAKLWQRQGKPKEAHEMLAEIYGWFTEGFDTKDLQEAKTLLEELH
jgi:predicted ATPase